MRVLTGTGRYFIIAEPLFDSGIFPAFFLLFAGAIKRADSEVQEDDCDACVDEKALVVGSAAPTGAQAIDALGKKEAEEGEEESGDFEPEDAARVDERSPDGLAELFCSGRNVFAAPGVIWRVLPNDLPGLGGALAQHP